MSDDLRWQARLSRRNLLKGLAMSASAGVLVACGGGAGTSAGGGAAPTPATCAAGWLLLTNREALTRVRQLRDYWESKQCGRIAPARADIDPSEIKSLLPYLIITDLFSDPLRVRIRLAGTTVCEAFGFNVAGRWLDELGRRDSSQG